MDRGAAKRLARYLDECRALVIEEIQRIVPEEQRRELTLYRLMLDYPLREAKGLRPALCVATCRALGGKLDAVLQSSAVLELYHNAFLIHDDIEDESWLRRGRPTLHREHGVPIAIHVGDAMLALSLQPLLDNMSSIGLGPALRILEAVATMTRQTVHGQALELDWIRDGAWDLTDADYLRMVELKTAWYSFITPVAVGAITARQPRERIGQLSRFALALGLAFQIQDDVLNLRGEEGAYGKEIDGDLWEGKRTLILLHAMRHMSADERSEASRILSLPRPPPPGQGDLGCELASLIDRLEASGSLDAPGAAEARATLDRLDPARRRAKTDAEVRWLRARVDEHRSVDYAAGVARAEAERAGALLDECAPWLPPSPHREVLEGLVGYVVDRVR